MKITFKSQTLQMTKAVAFLFIMSFSLLCSCTSKENESPSKPATIEKETDKIELEPFFEKKVEKKSPDTAHVEKKSLDTVQKEEISKELLNMIAEDTTPVKKGLSYRLESSVLTYKWSLPVGRTTFRTTMVVNDDGDLIIGSHGSTLNGLNEQNDGIYIIKAKEGKLKRFIPTPGEGDLDVSGVALQAFGTIIYSTNNGAVRAVTAEGQEKWAFKKDTKFRTVPALGEFNHGPGEDVAIGDTAGIFYIIDGHTGDLLSQFETGTNDYDARGFVSSAAIFDIDEDRFAEAICGARDGKLYAFDIGDSTHWEVHHHSGMHASPNIIFNTRDFDIKVLAAWSYGPASYIEIESGDTYQTYDTPLAPFSSPVPFGADQIVYGTSWWDERDGICLQKPGEKAVICTVGTVTASAVVSDIDGDGEINALFGTEAGEVVMVNTSGEMQKLITFDNAQIEATAMLQDIDKNGIQELYIAVNTGDKGGSLLCFETKDRGTPQVSRFRGNDMGNGGGYMY